MIPPFSQPHFQLGPLTIHGFGLLVAIGVMLGAELLRWRAGRVGLDMRVAQRMVMWVVLPGFIGAHLVDRFIYFPAETMAEPATIFKVWQGISSFGGFLGGSIGTVWFLRKEKLKGPDLWRYLDLVAYALPVGWIFGRFGCFVAFDHPGSQTTFFLAQMDAAGVIRHNLGLDEALYTIPLAGTLLWLGRKPRPPGFFVGMVAILYTPFRFALDFLRRIDVRYAGFSPAQYGCVVVFIVGVIFLRRARGFAAREANV